ncbi:unnamed protein product [Peniophora sp. CBMAI 1063]|nr:unnamed protein product [Peniophora sp. CBMAI 1063]
MIGNPPTFYDESAAHEQQPQGAYEAWQQQQYHYPPQQPQQQPIQNQYHFVNSGTAAHDSFFPPVTLNDYPAYFPPQPAYDAQADNTTQWIHHNPHSQPASAVSTVPPTPWPSTTTAGQQPAHAAAAPQEPAPAAPAATTQAPKRKRPRKGKATVRADADDSESDSGDDGPAFFQDDGLNLGLQTGPPPVGLPSRLPGACTYCKRLKMKCDFPPGANVCKRCRAGNHHCVVEGRKPRSAPNKREYLLAQLRQKDGIIESLLKQLHNPYLATPLSIAAYRMATPDADHHRQNVVAWLDRLQSSVRNPPRGPGGVDMQAFSLDSRVRATPSAKGGSARGEGESDEEDEEAEASSDDPPLSGSTAADEAQLPADPSVPIGALAQLAISSSYTDLASPQRKKNKAPSSPSGVKAKDGSTPEGETAGKEGAKEDGKTPDEDEEDRGPVGIANAAYFEAGPSSDLSKRMSLIDKTAPPDILVHGLVTPEDVEKLFQIFYTRVNPFIGVLDPVLHTPSSTFSRCPFLFTVVCAVALRYSQRSDAYPLAMHFAKSAAAHALVDGWKSVELCQAYILMSIYAVPARRWEEDRSWLYTGLAIRIATDLNLHMYSSRKPKNEAEARELINRTRVWMICFNLDKSTATQFGKPSTLKEDRIIREGPEWYNRSPSNDPFDIHLVAYSSLMRVLTRFHAEIFIEPDSSTGLNRTVDFHGIALKYDQELEKTFEEWTGRFQHDSDHNNPAAEFRCKLLPFYVNYSRLVVLSFAFQQAFQRGFERNDEVIFAKSLQAARTVINVLVDSLAPSGYLRYAPDGHFVFGAFASAFMLKLLRPECRIFARQGLDETIYSTIERLVHTFGAPAIAVDERHTPRLYSDFLGRLLAKHRRDAAAAARAAARQNRPGAGQQQRTQNQGQRQGGGAAGPGAGAGGAAQGQGGQAQHGGAQMQQRPAAAPELKAPANEDPGAGYPTPSSLHSEDGGQAQQPQQYATYNQQYAPAFATATGQPQGQQQLSPTYATYGSPGSYSNNGTSPAGSYNASPNTFHTQQLHASPSQTLVQPQSSPASYTNSQQTSPFVQAQNFAGFGTQGQQAQGQYQQQLHRSASQQQLQASASQQSQLHHSTSQQQLNGVYQADASVSGLFGTPQMGTDFNFAFDGGLPLISDDTPAPMKALSQSTFWDTMMMPGWSWPMDDPMNGGGHQQQQQIAQAAMGQQQSFQPYVPQVPVSM